MRARSIPNTQVFILHSRASALTYGKTFFKLKCVVLYYSNNIAKGQASSTFDMMTVIKMSINVVFIISGYCKYLEPNSFWDRRENQVLGSALVAVKI